MNNNVQGGGGGGSRPGRRPPRKSGGKPSRPGGPSARYRRPTPKSDFRVVDKNKAAVAQEVVEEVKPVIKGPFRILIAVHRPRYRGRAVRASALVGWEVTPLLNKQDVVGQVARLPGPPDLVLLSGDFGRQRDYAIFRAIQQWRAKGMQIIGMVEDCQTAPDGFPDSAPEKLCDVCLTPPYTAAGLRSLLVRLYEEKRGKPAPPPRNAALMDVAEEPDED